MRTKPVISEPPPRPFARRLALAAPVAVAVLLAGCSTGGGGPTAEDEAFALLEESHRLREAGDFDAARERLTRALETVPPETDAASAIRDELEYSLPLAQARRLARDGDTAGIPALLAPVREYIRDHPDRFARAREIADLLDGAGAPPAEGEARAFALLEESRGLKARRDFAGAAARLEQAAALVPAGGDAGRAIRDELHYYLPLARARDALTRHDPDGVEAALAPVSDYLEGHARRFELIRQVEELAESARMLRHAIGANRQARLRHLQVMLTARYMETGECPSDVEELSHWINQAGLDGPEAITAESLERRPDGCTARVRRVGGAGSDELRWP